MDKQSTVGLGAAPRVFGASECACGSKHVVAVESLPPLHKDPFDRLLVAQATVEGMLLLTADARVAGCPGPVRRVQSAFRLSAYTVVASEALYAPSTQGATRGAFVVGCYAGFFRTPALRKNAVLPRHPG